MDRLKSLSLIQKVGLGILGLIAVCACCTTSVFITDTITPEIETAEPVAIQTTAEVVVATEEIALTPLPTDTQAPTITPAPTSTSLPTSELFLPQALSGDISLAAIPGSECLPEGSIPEMGEVISITDGDTIEVRNDGADYKVRYIGIDTPEMDDVLGPEAKEINSQLVAGKQVYLVKDKSETDRYDRLLRYVFVDDMFVNYELVKSGFARSTAYPPDTACQTVFNQGQEEARLASLGVWQIEPTIEVPPPRDEVDVMENIIIRDIFYDGIVKRVESDEYAVIANVGETPVDLSGWRLNAGAEGQDFRFPQFILEPGGTCRVYTDEDHPEFCGFSFRNNEALWNNKGDCGYLYNSDGHLIDEYCY